MTRSPGEIDRELALLAAVRTAVGAGSLERTDELLDERNRLLPRSTTREQVTRDDVQDPDSLGNH